jgi:hypothetical protein
MALNEAGKKATAKWVEQPQTDPFGVMRNWSVPIATKEFVAVTGIRALEQLKAAQVEYQWRWRLADDTKEYITRLCPTETSQLNLKEVQSGSVQYAKYDDGWRLQR